MKVKEELREEYNQFVKINSEDAYSYAVVTYMHQWADLMESEMAKGKPLSEVADKASHDADTEGITGFMYGCAAAALAKYWEHGEELRLWHNNEYGYQGDGVVNPAVITIGTGKQ